jgi:AcrR family transcriptional regulator
VTDLAAAFPGRAPRRAGRPRDARARHVILQATRTVLASSGFAGLTVDAVATTAGVGKATIYRRWPSRERLVLDAVREVTAPITVPDTGALRSDLVAFAEAMSGDLTTGVAQVLPGLAAAAAHSPALREELVAFAAERRAHVRSALGRAAARGELRPGTDLDVAVEQLVGPVVYRMVVTGSVPTGAEVGAMIDQLLAGIGPR